MQAEVATLQNSFNDVQYFFTHWENEYPVSFGSQIFHQSHKESNLAAKSNGLLKFALLVGRIHFGK